MLHNAVLRIALRIVPIVILAACGRDHPQVVTATVLDDADAHGCPLKGHPFERAMPKRLVAIGDLHGDLAAARAALKLAGAIGDDDHWIGGDLAIVQTGDVLDRGDGEQAIVDLFERLEREAADAGGSFTWLLGNHELMNAVGDFRYVTEAGWQAFGGARATALAPGGSYAKILAGQDIAVKIGDTVFSHAGFLPTDTADPAKTNLAVRCWLDGDIPEPGVETDNTSAVWTRAWGTAEVDCDLLRQTLAALGATRMVVAHTPQPEGITSACDGALWRIDTGMTAYYGGPVQALELTASGATVLRASSD
jgi:hypothetical protein